MSIFKRPLALASIFGLMSTMAYAGNCDQFPAQNGPVTLQARIGDSQLKMRANFKISEGVEFGQNFVSHEYKGAQFYLNGKQAYLNSASVDLVFKAFGYSHVEWKRLKQLGFFESLPILDQSLKVKAARSGDIVVDPQSVIIPYDAQCSNWRY